MISCYMLFFFFKQKTAYEMRISDWSSDVCSSDLLGARAALQRQRLCMGCQHGAQVAQRHNPHPFRALIQMGQGSAFGIKATAFVDTGSNLPIRTAYPRSCRPTDRRPGRKGRFLHQNVPIRISLRYEEHTLELQYLLPI